MGAPARAILVVHDDDLVGHAVVQALHATDVPVRVGSSVTLADDLASSAFGCRAIIAVGDRFAANPAVLGAANMPGVRALVVVVRGDVDLKPIRTRGVPYTVLRLAPMLEDVIAAVLPHVCAGKLIVDPKHNPAVVAVTADDAAACAVAAVDADDACGRVFGVAAPDRPALSEFAVTVARAAGRELKVSASPRWALAALRAIGRRAFALPPELIAAPPADDLSLLHPGPWRTVDEIAKQTMSSTVASSRRNDEHAALGM